MNLIILSAAAATLSSAIDVIVTYILVGMVFVMAMGIIVYHLHLRCFAKSALWLKIKSKVSCYQQDSNSSREENPLIQPDETVSKTIVNLDSPILDD